MSLFDTMLRSITQAKTLGHLRTFIMRASTANISPSTVVSSKKSFPSESLKEKINRENDRVRTKILTIPNCLTMSRLATSPAIGYFIWNGMNSHALACFAYAATTDLLDGFIARRFNQESDLGAILDPIADKVLLPTSLICMYNVGMVPLWLVKITVIKDVVLLAGGAYCRYITFDQKPTFREYFDFQSRPTIGFEVTLLSKCNTALQCLLIATQLSTHHMAGTPLYDWSIFAFQLTTFTTTLMSLASYLTDFEMQKLTPPKSKGSIEFDNK